MTRQHAFVAWHGSQGSHVKLLPAYVKRGRLEEKVVLGAVSKDTLDEAFTYLKERLDPEEDVFDSAARFRSMAWVPGEPVKTSLSGTLKKQSKLGLARSLHACLWFLKYPWKYVPS